MSTIRRGRRELPGVDVVLPGTEFRALCVMQSYANNIALRRKTIETRIWPTDYRGDVLIVSSRRPRIHPFGCGICVVRIANCRPMRPEDERAAMVPYQSGLYAWDLADVRPMTPFKLDKGQMKFFTVAIPADQEVRWIDDFNTVVRPGQSDRVERYAELPHRPAGLVR